MNVINIGIGGSDLGKVLAQQIIPDRESMAESQFRHDGSINNLIRRYRTWKETLS